MKTSKHDNDNSNLPHALTGRDGVAVQGVRVEQKGEMVSEYLSIEAASASEAITEYLGSFDGVEADSDEEYALLAVLPRPKDKLAPFNDVTTVQEFTRDKDGKYLVELGESGKMKKLKKKLKKVKSAKVELITPEQAKERMPKGEE